MTFKCGTCWKSFRSRAARETHFEDAGHDAPPHECPAPTCPEFCDTDLTLWQHMGTCRRLARAKFGGVPWADTYFFCENCETLFCGTTAKDDHECIGYACDRCDGFFDTLTALTRHLVPIFLLENEGDDLRQALFERVQEDDRRGLLSRLESVYNVPFRPVDDSIHLKGDQYQCHLCLQMYDKRSGLQDHFRSHAHADHHYRCTSCNAKLTTLSAAVGHLEIDSKKCTKAASSSPSPEHV